jgi:hypothetical protein
MSESPQVESPNTLTIDFQDAPEVREIFGTKEVGEHCTIKVQLQIMSRYPEGVQCAIEKIISEGGYGSEDRKIEAEPDSKEPVMMTIKAKNRKHRGMEGPRSEEMRGGPKSRPPQTAENSAEPWLTSYT